MLAGTGRSVRLAAFAGAEALGAALEHRHVGETGKAVAQRQVLEHPRRDRTLGEDERALARQAPEQLGVAPQALERDPVAAKVVPEPINASRTKPSGGQLESTILWINSTGF